MIFKSFNDPIARLILKSKVSDGRLKLSYGKERDAYEDNSLSNFVDERLHKNIEIYNVKRKKNELADDDQGSYHSELSDQNEEKSNKKSNYNQSYKLLQLFSTKRKTTFVGNSTRILPSSPFLQLGNIGSMDQVQFEDNQNRKIKISELNHLRSKINLDDESDIVKPDILLLQNGDVSPYQPGFTTAKDQKRFSSINNEDDFNIYRRMDDFDKSIEVRSINYPSIYFLPNKFQPLFTFEERRKIFQKVIPEIFVDNFTAALRDTESKSQSIESSLNGLEQKFEKLLALILLKNGNTV
jgi:hypothetical protein